MLFILWVRIKTTSVSEETSPISSFFPVPSRSSKRWHHRDDANHTVAFEMPVSDTLMGFLCSPQTLNKNNLLPPEESCNFFPSPMPQTNVYATTYYPTPLGKYDFPPLDSPCSYMHSWWTHLQTFGFNVCMCVCDRGYIPVSVHTDAFENARIYRNAERTAWVNVKWRSEPK